MKEARALNKIVRLTTQNTIDYEANSRQAEKLSAECGFEAANFVAKPGIRNSSVEIPSDIELRTGLCTVFSGSAARGEFWVQTAAPRSSPARRCVVPWRGQRTQQR